MRIISMLPAATEIAAALGLLEQLVGVSHECDYPPEVNALPRVTECPIYNAGLTSAEIDRAVRASLAAGETLYRIDEPLMRDLRPDLVLSQALCDVCAIGYGTVAGLLDTLLVRPHLLNLEPHRLEDLYRNITEVAEAAGVPERATALNAGLRARVAEVQARLDGVSRRPRVLHLEWIDPLFYPGHWTPEIITLASGECLRGEPGLPSTTFEWEQAAALAPEALTIACCGYGIDQTRPDMALLESLPGWDELPAVRAGQVYVINGTHYFNRSGPRLIDSLEIMAEILHPDRFQYPGAERPWIRWETAASRQAA